MPPFSNKEEKKEYILAHKHLFDALGINLTPDKLKEIVDDESNYARYEAAQEYSSLEAKRVRESETAFGEKTALRGTELSRVAPLLYAPEDTPEAKRWNDNINSMVNDPNGPRRFAEFLLRGILDYDESIATESFDDTFSAAMKNKVGARIMLEGYHITENCFPNIFDMNNPREAALVKAAQEKYRISQPVANYMKRNEYEASKLFTILPELSEAEAFKLYDIQLKRRNQPGALEESKVLAEKVNSITLEKQHAEMRPYLQQLQKIGLVGKNSSYYKIYRVTDKGKEYITRDDLVKAIKANQGLDKIKYEEASIEEHDALKSFLNSSQKVEIDHIWTSKEEKRAFLKAMRPALASVNYELTDEKIENLVDDDLFDQYTLEAREVVERFKKPQRDFGIDETNKKADRLLQALYIPGERPEDREWNDKVSLLAQTSEGIDEMARIAAKRLLDVPMEILTNNNMETMTKYLLEHPVERQLFILSSNVIEAYQNTLKPEEASNDPVVVALKGRISLMENIHRVNQNAVVNASRFFNLFSDISAEQMLGLMSGNLARAIKSTDNDAAKKFLGEALADIQNRYDFDKDLISGENTTSKVDVVRDLYLEGILKDDLQYKTISAKVVEKDENGVAKPAVERNFTVQQMIEAIANGELKSTDFKFKDISPEEKTKLENFLKDTPTDVTLAADDKEIKRLREMKYIRGLNMSNEGEIRMFANELAGKRAEDPEFAALDDACAKNGDQLSSHEALQAAFEYLNSHRHPITEFEHKKFDLALMTLAAVDGNCAKELVNRINAERRDRFYLEDPTIDFSSFLHKHKIKATTVVERERFDIDNPFDKRITNIKEIYEHLDKDLDPFYHKNSDDFKAMMQSMKNIKDYLEATKKPDAKVVENMITKVKNTSKTYLTNNNNPWTYLGKNRTCAALAVIAAIDPKEGESLLHNVCAEKREWARQLCNVVGKKTDTITTRDVLNREKLTGSPKEEILEKIAKDISRTQNAAADAATLEEKAELTAQYMVKKRILNALKGDNLDRQAIIDMMSKNTVREATGKVTNDDIYRSVINSFRTTHNSSVNKSIEAIENEFMKREQAEVEAKEAKEKARNEAVAVKEKSPEVANPVVAPQAH